LQHAERGTRDRSSAAAAKAGKSDDDLNGNFDRIRPRAGAHTNISSACGTATCAGGDDTHEDVGVTGWNNCVITARCKRATTDDPSGGIRWVGSTGNP